jgi:hypothetical protein
MGAIVIKDVKRASADTMATALAAFSTNPINGDLILVAQLISDGGLDSFVTAVSVANPTQITTYDPHGMSTGDTVVITGSTCTPSIDGLRTVTVTGANTYTVPVNVTASPALGFGVCRARRPQTAPTDNYGNTYTQVGSGITTSTNNVSLSMWMAENVTGGSAFVVTGHPNCQFNEVQAWLIRNTKKTGSYNGDWRGDVQTPLGTGTTTVTPGADSIFIAFGVTSVSKNLTASGGGNATGVNGFDATMANAAKGSQLFGQYKISSAVTSASWSGSGGYTGAAMIASFAPVQIAQGVGSSQGESQVTGNLGASAGIAHTIGSATGESIASATGYAITGSEGYAEGESVVTGQGINLVAADGYAEGESIVEAVGQEGMWPESVMLIPIIEDDGWGGPLIYEWTQVSGPVPGATIVTPDAAQTEILFDEVDGIYIFQFRATRTLDGLTSTVLFRVTIYTSASLVINPNHGQVLSNYNPVTVTANGSVKDTGVRYNSIRISENSQGNNTAMLTMDGNWIDVGNEVIIERGGIRLFGGICTSLRVQYAGNIVISYHPTMTGYAWHLGRMHVRKVYTNQSMLSIITDLLSMSQGGISLGYVEGLSGNVTVAFDETPVDDALTILAKMVPKLKWRVDHFRSFHMATVEPGDPAPLTLSHPNMKSLSVTRTINRTANRARVYFTIPSSPVQPGDTPILEDGTYPGTRSGFVHSFEPGDTEIEIESPSGWNRKGGTFTLDGCTIHYTGIAARNIGSVYGHIGYNYMRATPVEAGDGDFSWKNRIPSNDIWTHTETLTAGMDIHKTATFSYEISITTRFGETPPIQYCGGPSLQDWIGVPPHQDGVGDPTGYYQKHEHHESGIELWVLGMFYYDDLGPVSRLPPTHPDYNKARQEEMEATITNVQSLNLYRYSGEESHPGDSLGQIFLIGGLSARGGVFTDRVAKQNLAPITEPRLVATPIDDGYGNTWYPWDSPPRYFLIGVTGICGKVPASPRNPKKPSESMIEVNDFAAQNALAALLGGGDNGVIETSMHAGEMSEADAYATGWALLANAKGLGVSATAAVIDPSAHPGQIQSINLPWPAGDAELNIQQVDIQGFERGVPHYNEVTAATEILNIEDILRSIR